MCFYFSLKGFEITSNFFGEIALDSGYGLKKIQIMGNEIIKQGEIYNLVSGYIDQNTFSLPIWKIKQELEEIPWCKKATVVKKLPNEVIIKILEHRPFAILNDFEVITADFYSIIKYDRAFFLVGLLRINSSNINEARNFIKTLKSALPDQIFTQIKEVEYISNRRWNIVFLDNLLVKLPEEHLNSALQQLVKIYSKNKSLNENLSVIDLRLQNKVFFS